MKDSRIRQVTSSPRARFVVGAALLVLGAILLWLARDDQPAAAPPATLAAAPREESAHTLPEIAVGAEASPMPLLPEIDPGLSTLPKAPNSMPAAAPEAVARTRTLDVLVVDANGKPVAGANIEAFGELLVRKDDFVQALKRKGREPTRQQLDMFKYGLRIEQIDPAWDEPLGSWISIADGSARVTLPAAATMLVATHAELGSSGVVDVPPKGEESGSTAVWTRLELSPMAVVQGLVLDRAGRPAPGARVVMELTRTFGGTGRPRVPLPLFSDQSGRYRTVVDTPNFALLHAELDGRATLKERTIVGPGQTSEVVLRFPGDFAITGVVIGPGGKPVPEADVDVAGWAVEVDEVSADEHGRFRLELNGASHVVLTCSADDLVPAEGVPVTLTDAQPVADVVLRLVEPATIAGRVQWADGTPIARQMVFAHPAYPNASEMSAEEGLAAFDSPSMDVLAFEMSLMDFATSDDDGRFVLEGIHPDHAMDLSCGGASGQAAEVELKGVRPGTEGVLFVLERAIAGSNRLGGRVVDSDTGTPIPRYELQWLPWAYGLQAPFERSRLSVDDPSARFEIGELVGGVPMRLVVEAMGYPSYDFGPFTPAADADLELRLGHHASLAILVRDESGAPQSGVQVQLMSGGESGLHVFLSETMVRDTGRDGRLLWPDLKPGEYSIEAVLGDARSKRQRVNVPSGRQLPVELTLKPPAGSGVLEVRTLRADGTPWAAAQVKAVLSAAAEASSADLDPVYRSSTDDSGRVRFGGLQPGTWSVTVVGTGGWSIPMHRADVAAGAVTYLTVNAPK